jgi:hypothetical protein
MNNTQKEYHMKKREQLESIISSTLAQTAIAKKELLKIKRKQYLIANKEKLALQKKVWHQNHSDDLKRRNKEYYEKNRQNIHDTSTSCGQIISLGYKRQHLKTKRHFIQLEKINNK